MEPATAAEQHAEPAEHEEDVEEAAEGAAVADGPPAKKQRLQKKKGARGLEKLFRITFGSLNWQTSL